MVPLLLSFHMDTYYAAHEQHRIAALLFVYILFVDGFIFPFTFRLFVVGSIKDKLLFSHFYNFFSFFH